MMSETSGDQATTGTRILRGAAAGLVGGMLGSFAMDRFQAAVSALSRSGGDDEAEPATSKAADKIVCAVTGKEVPTADKPLAGQLVHYVLGAGLGVAYGIAAEFRPAVTTGYGTAFGFGVAGVLDEAAVPAAGLGSAPWKVGLSAHAYTLASHLVFGGVADLTRRQVSSSLRGAG